MAAIFLYNPVINKLQQNQPLNPVAENPVIGHFVFFCMSMLAAPLVFFATIVPSTAEKFKNTLETSLKD